MYKENLPPEIAEDFYFNPCCCERTQFVRAGSPLHSIAIIDNNKIMLTIHS